MSGAISQDALTRSQKPSLCTWAATRAAAWPDEATGQSSLERVWSAADRYLAEPPRFRLPATHRLPPGSAPPTQGSCSLAAIATVGSSIVEVKTVCNVVVCDRAEARAHVGTGAPPAAQPAPFTSTAAESAASRRKTERSRLLSVEVALRSRAHRTNNRPARRQTRSSASKTAPHLTHTLLVFMPPPR